MPTTITVITHGPLKIEGDLKLVDGAGAEFGLSGRTALWLCRCGQSAKKPLCDGTHKKCGFQSEVKAETLPPGK
jgi:CDGSH-type Zn-finger protein